MQMKIGDLVMWRPPNNHPGSLTAAKYFQRTSNRIRDNLGIIVGIHGNNVSVAFGNDLLILSKKYLEVVDG